MLPSADPPQPPRRDESRPGGTNDRCTAITDVERSPTDASLTLRLLEGAGCALLVALLWGLDTLTMIEARARTGVGLDDFRLYTEQATSAVAALLMVPLVARWLGRFPLRRADWSRSIPAHLLGSLLFTAGHYAAMVAQRIVVFRLAGMEYLYRHDPLANLAFEYTKDVKIYLGILLVVALYRRLRRGASAAAPASAPADTPNRLLVQTGAGERLLELSEIDYLQAARNYVSVHAGGREYLVRDTIASLSSRLAASGFLRSHRSYLVNAARIDEVRPAADGAWELRLRGGSRVPLSRSYRDAVRERIRNAAST